MRAFKGTKVTVSNVVLQGGALVRFDVQFRSADGIVHATTSHAIEVPAKGPIREGVKTLLQGLISWAEETHFHNSTPKPAKALHGIAESLSMAEPIDEPTEQG